MASTANAIANQTINTPIAAMRSGARYSPVAKCQAFFITLASGVASLRGSPDGSRCDQYARSLLIPNAVNAIANRPSTTAMMMNTREATPEL